MKDQKDMDWELFEMLEGDLSPEEESELLKMIEDDADLAADWDFMRMTQLDAPEVVYQGKDKLIKTDTTLIAFSAVQWRRAAAIAALLALCYPTWQLFMPKTDAVEGLAGSATELVLPNTDNTINSQETKPTVEVAVQEVPNHPPSDVKEPRKSLELPVPMNEKMITTPDVANQLVSVEPLMQKNGLNTESKPLESLHKANVMYNMEMLIPQDEPASYNGVRSTINAGLSLVTAPFRNAKIKVQPADKQSIQIIYSSEQYNATAMVSLKPLK
ncbi:MAG: hypothetical protein KC517_08150 [Bacteroidetes bacterium]|jgi:hypothetical protein|nr:hypothetical protein [Bacteroidota bacterium]